MSEETLPVMYSESKCGHWRHGVEESEIECCLWFFYQDKDHETGEWCEKSCYDIYVDVPNWEEVKKCANALFAFLDGADCSKTPYSSPEFKIFDQASYYCLVVTESADCPGDLELDHMEWDKELKGYRSRGASFGPFDKDAWERFSAVVDKFIEEVF